MKSTYRFNLSLLIVLLLLGAAPVLTFSQGSMRKIKVEINPHHIHANQPVSLKYSYAKDGLFEAVKSADVPKPEGFSIVVGPNSTQSTTFINGKISYTASWDYILVPSRAGDLLLPSWSFKVDSTIYRSDSLWIHIYDERVSSEDSLKQLQAMRSKDEDDLWWKMGKMDKRMDGIHFFKGDSSYTATVGERVFLLYSLSFVNVRGMSSAKLENIQMEQFPRVRSMVKISVTPRTSISTMSGYEEFTKDYIVVVLTKRKGKFTIPRIAFNGNGETYRAPKIKVVVNE